MTTHETDTRKTAESGDEHELTTDVQWFTGSPQTHRVTRAIAQYGPIARTTLAQLLGLSQGALSRITSDLIYEGVIEELPGDTTEQGRLPQGFIPKESREKRGRPQTNLRLRAGERTFLGINIHGSEVSIVAVNALCRPVGPCRTVTLESTKPQDVAATIGTAIRKYRSDVTPSPVAVGLSFGGHAEDDRYVTYAPFLHWDGRVDAAGAIEQTGGLPTAVFNDLDSLLLYESWFGAGIGVRRFAVVTIGAGVGYSLAEDGMPVDYPDKSYGLAGHILVDPEGPRCYAGHTGCSQCLTNDSLAEEYSDMVGHMVTFDQFAADAQEGTAQARQLLNRLCFRLGVLVSTVANFAMPSKVLISGESSFLAKMNQESIRSGINWYRPSQAATVDFEILDFSWESWAKAAAARAIARYIGGGRVAMGLQSA